jgi:glycosyltransferase involved in cell wall biosynthesis
MNKQTKICLAYLGNPFHDSRMTNLPKSLKEDGCKVSIISFDWFISRKNYFDDEVKVFKLTKGKISLFFYLSFAGILIRELLKSDADIFFAEDIYTLPFVFIIAKLKHARIYYNSREIYAFIGGLRNRPYIQSLIRNIEKIFITKVDLVLTTGWMDSSYLEKTFEINNTLVIRNIPIYQIPTNKVDFRKVYGLNENTVVLLYQGVLLEGRGVPNILRSMTKLPDTVLIVVGDGEQKKNFINLAETLGVRDRVIFTGMISQNELINYTAGADIGLVLIENISLSYYYALPTKLFEYIMAALPLLSSDLPQMKEIIEKYNVGESISIGDDENIINVIRKWISEPDLLVLYRKNCQSAALELNWQEEYKRVRTKLLSLK